MENYPFEEKAKAIQEHFECYGQSQVFRFWNDLDGYQRSHLIRQAESIDLPKISEHIRAFLFPEQHKNTSAPDKTFSSAPYLKLPETEADQSLWEEAYVQGEAALHAGKVAVLTIAGGQGTRLGFEGPKGTLGVTPVHRKSLFQVFAEKIRFAEKKYGHFIHWFIMTSQRNHEETIQFFKKNHSFGIQHIHFFQQGLMPAVDFHGKILLEAKDRISMQPDGSGGVFRAFVGGSFVNILQYLNVEIISLCHIDNPLVNVIDPYFIGFHIQQRSNLSFRTIPKQYPEECVGLFVLCEGRTTFVEYTDLLPEQALACDPLGRLKLHAANAGIYIFDREFVQKLGHYDGPLPCHAAKKKVPAIDDNGNPLASTSANGIKFEHCLPDTLALASHSLLLEGKREEIFSPIKNAHGTDSPVTCHHDQLRLFAHWLTKVGVEIPVDASGLPPFDIEISPLFADNERAFLEKWASLSQKPVIGAGTYIE
ncbi:MAG: UTP--glucose-1-phosphate uridylyltransferase [Puniceicoccales bacterium]|jgi:UDP-N-acetylglucosamine/UDP-N-acetylgalactosamine diphosphorylase|nr:UTP--glucose-1-phosphate uridylyltransferase [Puniceicoccales bacterium]